MFGHGFLLVNGEKMSKSVGNVVDPANLVDAFGLDAVRFFLMREVSFGQDGSYSEESIINRINSDLANNLGNLAQRSLSMVAKNCGGAVPEHGEFTEADRQILDQAAASTSPSVQTLTSRHSTALWNASGPSSQTPTPTSQSRNPGPCARTANSTA